MEIMRFEGTDDTPGILLDAAAGVFEISGRSMPEDATKFYEPVLDWIEEYKENPLGETVFIFKMKYFNTASSKVLLDILLILEELAETGAKVMVKWHYPSNDEDMKEAGEEYAEMIEVPFEHISY
ncbi:MAG: DUF1987 domain-containing protein [Bacteroidota bacterium]